MNQKVAIFQISYDMKNAGFGLNQSIQKNLNYEADNKKKIDSHVL